jgi:CubicO group peptidase (beta-lactamase class C family)
LPPDYWTFNWDNPFYDHSKQIFISNLMVTQLDTTHIWNYSNLGYALLGMIADSLTENRGIENIISLMNLKNSTVNLEYKLSTSPHNFGHEVENWHFPSFNRYMGGVKSSSEDLAKFLKFQIQNNAVFSNTKFHSNILINEKDSLVSKDGWFVFYRNKEEVIWHNGISGGYNSFIGFNNQTKSGVVILSNTQSTITDLGLHFLSSSFPLNSPKRSLVQKIEQYINLEQLDSVEFIWNAQDTFTFNKNPLDLYWLQCHYISKEEFSKLHFYLIGC